MRPFRYICRTLRSLLVALPMLAVPALATVPVGYVSITGSNLVDSTGTPVVSATISFAPVSNAGAPISYRIGGIGQSIQSPVTAQVVNGAFTIQVADTVLTSPVNVCFAVTAVDNVSGNSILGPGYGCVQPAGSGTAVTGSQAWCTAASGGAGGTCNFDNYTPNLAALVAAQYGPTPSFTATATTLAPGVSATATIGGTPAAPTLNLGIPQGAPGPPTAFDGPWSGSTPYVFGHAVSFNGSSFVALVGNTNVQPPSTCVANSTWSPLACNATAVVSTPATQPGAALINGGTGVFNASGFPTASKVRGGAISTPSSSFNCATLTDVAAQQWCVIQQGINFNAGLQKSSTNNIFGNFSVWWNMDNTATIASLFGSHTLTLGSGGAGAPVKYGGNAFPNAVRFGYVANDFDAHTALGSGAPSQFNNYSDTVGTDASCYSYSLLGLDCTVMFTGRMDPGQFSFGATGTPSVTATEQVMLKSHGYKITIGTPTTVSAYDATSAGFLSATCPGAYTYGAYTQPTTASLTDFTVWLLISHTGTVACAIDDGAASSTTAFTFANDTAFTLGVGGVGVVAEAVAIAPTLLTQAQRAQLFNSRFHRRPVNFTTPDFTLLDQYQIQCGDYYDNNLCTKYTNGTVGGQTGSYLGTHGAASITFQTDAKRISYTMDPGVGLDNMFGSAVHVNGSLRCMDLMYATDRQNSFSCELGNTTGALQTVNIRIGGGRGNIGAIGLTGISPGDDFSNAVLYSGLQGGFLDSIYYPKGAKFIAPQSLARPASTAVLWCDSVCTGNGSIYNAAVAAWVPLEIYSPGGNSFGTADVAMVGTGSVSTWNSCPSQAACDAYVAAQLAGMSVTWFIDQRITNDFLHGCGLTAPEGLANYTLAVGYLYNSVHTLYPSAHIISLGPEQLGAQPPTAHDGCASSSNTVANYGTAKSGVCSADNTAWAGTGTCVYYDMTSSGNGCPQLSNAGDYQSDATHTTEQGSRKAIACIKTYMGASNPTSISHPI